MPLNYVKTNTPLPPRPKHWRRPSKANETGLSYIRTAIPAGSLRAVHGRQVVAALLNDMSFAVLTKRRQRNIAGTLEHLIRCADYDTMTTRPGWESIMAAIKASRATVARCLAFLRERGLLGIVASGRSAEFSPTAENEAAVYVLCIPGGDQIEIPPAAKLREPLENKEETPARAREEKPHSDAAPPRLTDSLPVAGTVGSRSLEHWPAYRTPKTPRQRLSAASELRHRVFVLRRISPRHVRSACRDFFVAGWAIADVLHALDHRPDGSRWPHSGADGVGNVGAWLRYRLSAWRLATGEPLPSREQRRESERREQLARQAIERRRILEELAERAERPRVDSPAKAKALAFIRSLKARHA